MQRSLWISLVFLLGAVSSAGAQEKPAAEVSEEGKASSSKAEAQESVNKAKKLAKVRRFDEAITLLEEAYLVLEDPELLRILGEVHLDKKDAEGARHYLKLYLEDSRVGDRAKSQTEAAFQKRLAELEPEKTGSFEVSEGLEDAGITGWQSSGARSKKEGELYLVLAGGFFFNQGAEFTTRRGGDGENQNDKVTEDWSHGGVGGSVEFGFFPSDGLALGVHLGLYSAEWGVQEPAESFEVTPQGGLKPELLFRARYDLGWGFQFGGSVGADAVIFSETLDCPEGVECGNLGSDGYQGFRFLYGAILGYRAEITEDFSLGLDTSFHMAPLFVTSSGAVVDQFPSYTDNSWLLDVSFAMEWAL